MSGSKVIAYIIAIILPPLSVFMTRGVGKDLLINIILCICAYFPGMLHAAYLVSRTDV